MANRALFNDLPKYPVCTVSELLHGAPSPHSVPHADHINRRIVKLANAREIIIVLHPVTNEVFAMDRFCYHHGYPLENGDIEDIMAVEPFDDRTAAEKKNSSGSMDEEIKKNNARRGEGQVIPRQKGPLKFNKEEHLKAMSKSLQQQQKQPLVNEKSTSSSSTSATSTIDYKLVQPGRLEVDYDKPEEFQNDPSFFFPIITCTLHNRIFDFRTGDMISRSVVRKPIASSSSSDKNQSKQNNDQEQEHEEEKCLISESTGCHQRIHPISIDRGSTNNNTENDDGDNGNDDGIIFVHDTFGYSVPMRRPGSTVNMQDRSHLMFLAKKKVLSDKENKVVEQQKTSEVKKEE